MFNISKIVDDDGDLRAVPPAIKSDRKRFHPVTKIILQYCVDNNLAISNPMLLVHNDNPVEQDLQISFVVNVYSDNPLLHANNLSNAIFEQCTRYIFLKTLIPYKEFELYVLARVTAKFYSYPSINDRRSGNSMVNISRVLKRFDNIKINLFDPEIQLINIYHKLYRPFPDDWHEYLHLEKVLFEAFRWRYETRKGGSKDSKESKSQVGKRLRGVIYDHLNDSFAESILVGAWALKSLLDVDPEFEKIQLLVEPYDTDTWATRFTNVLGTKVSYDIADATILDDYWLKRCTFKVIHNGEKIPIIDIFNSLDYEIIPWVTSPNGHRVGNPYVLSRFLLIDRWVLSLLSAMNVVPHDLYTKKAAAVHKYITKLRTMKDLCFGDNYSGTYRDLVVERRKLIREQERFLPYEPEGYLEQHGKLRTMEK